MRADYIPMREMQHILAALMPQNRLVCEVCLATGLRISDALSLKTASLAPVMMVIEHKTGKKKRIRLPKQLLARLFENAGNVYVFEHRTDENKHRCRQAVWRDIKRASKLFRIPKNVSCHSTRKLYAVNKFHKHGDLHKLKIDLNHTHDSVTLLYAFADIVSQRKKK